MTPSFSAPRPIAKGSHVRIIAPSSPFEQDAFERAVNRLRDRYEISYREDIFERDGFFAGSNARRIEELHQALNDSSIDAILAARGGYGAARLLEHISPEQVARADKPLMGFSDITALHALWARAGLQSVHSPMLSSLAEMTDSEWQDWVNRIERQECVEYADLECLSRGAAAGARANRVAGASRGSVGASSAGAERAQPITITGPLLGGNLAVLCSLLGTPYFPPIDGAILFLEDTDEVPYRLDRMLAQLRMAGIFDRIAAVIFGAFTRCERQQSPCTVQQVLINAASRLPCPVYGGLPHGHPPSDRGALSLGAPSYIEHPAPTAADDAQQSATFRQHLATSR